MKKAKKVLLLVLCAVLLVGASVAATVAYLTSTKTVTNTFTVGNVQIKLDEANLDAETGETLDGRTESGNENVRLIPGRTIGKDPTVTVLQDSENCYVRMKVKVTNIANLKKAFEKLTYTGVHGEQYYVTEDGMFKLHLIVNGWTEEEWAFVDCTSDPDNDANVIYEFRYVGEKATDVGYVPKNTTDNTVLSDLFTELTIPKTMTGEYLAYLEYVDIIVTAEAIQAEGFNNANDAWSVFSAN